MFMPWYYVDGGGAVTAEELQDLLNLLREAQTDTASIEAKRAEKELPRRLWETLSAFANTPGGGVILLGVDEESQFAVTGVSNPGKIQADLASLCDQMEPPLRPLIQIHQVENHNVVTAAIPEIDYRLKPCYYRDAGLIGGSFIRVADGDRHLTNYEIQTFFEGRGQPVHDLEPVPNRSLSDLDGELIQAFLARLRSKAGVPYAGWADERLLRLFRVTTESDGRLAPTLAGYLCFGIYPQEDFPGLYLSVVRYSTPFAGEPGPKGERLLDNVKVEGSIPRMLLSASAVITRNLQTRAVVVGLLREDVPEYPTEILRESIVNALGHRDYSPLARGTPIQVRLFPDRLEIDNPGGLFGPVTVERLGEPGIQASRNSFLMKLMEDLPVPGWQGVLSENRGTGITSMLATLRRAGMTPPKFDDRRTSFRITFSNATLLKSEILAWLTGLGDPMLTDNQRLALAFAHQNGRITNAEYCRLNLADSRAATRELGDLVRRGLLVQHGVRRWAHYEPSPLHSGVPGALSKKMANRRRADNRDRIIDLLRQKGPLARIDIARELSLSPSATRRWLQILRRDGVVAITTPSIKSPEAKYRLISP